MIIKKASPAELKKLQHIGARSYVPHYTHLWKEGGVDWYLRRCFAGKVLQVELSDANIEYYIISEQGKSVGILKLVLRKSLPDSDVENALYLEKIYFVKEWTGKGVGHKAMQFAFDRARDLDRDCIWLMAMDTSEKPIAAYQRAGFTEHSRTRLDFEMMKEEYRGMVVMKNYFEDDGN